MRLLVTGAAGNMGRLLRPRLARPGRILRLVDVGEQQPAGDGEEVLTASVTDAAAMAGACAGADAVLHLGGISLEAPWEEILAVNIDGTRTVLDAARAAGVRTVILASSNHAAGYHTRATEPLPADVAARPDTYYGMSKAAMEALGRLYADRYGLVVVCVRIGSCFPEPGNARGLATWLSPDDCARLVEAALALDEPGFRLVWGISRNTRRWWSLAEGEAIGYHPVDDAEVYADRYPAGSDDELRHVGGGFLDVPLGSWMR